MSDTKKPAPPYSIGADAFSGLSKLIEECGEVLQVVGKLLATGGRADHWDGTDLHVRLRDELADLEAAIMFFSEVNDYRSAEYLDRQKTKLVQFWKWEEEQSS